ncbi:MAG TPA: dTDP-4-dehydrorhamnose reductase, partial [Acidobacteriota bacterium]|nr:dTDP-4-dehydrorhamnose reductase [Acidobacteriota bacterium]
DSTPLNQRIILFGSGGMVGSALAKAFNGRNFIAYSHQELDITDYVALQRSFLKAKPELVLNAAAFTRVDDCERLRETAFLVNAEAAGHLAALCKKYAAFLVHFSTDYIFDGHSEKPYSETDTAAPVNYYGTSKWEGEKKILGSGCSHLIVRSSWIFGQNGDNFVKKILKRALASARLQVPADQICSPTFSGDIAAAVIRLLSMHAAGIYHYTSSGHCSRFEQAETILQLYGLNNSVEAIKSEILALPAKRPRFSALDVAKYRETTGHLPRTWQQSTAEYIAFLKQNEHELRS